MTNDKSFSFQKKNQKSFKDVYEKLPTEEQEDVEMIEEPAVTITTKQREHKNEKKEFVPSTIRNEIDIDVSMLERKESEKASEDKEMTEGWKCTPIGRHTENQ